MSNKFNLPVGMTKRGRVYYSHFRFEGKPVRQRLSPDFEIAKEMMARLRHKLYRRSIGDISNDYSIEKLTQEWLRSASQKLAETTTQRYKQHISHFHRLLPVTNVSGLSVDIIEDFRAIRLQETTGRQVHPQTVNKDVAALNNMLNWAVKRKKIGSNPITGISELPTRPRDSRALAPEEVDCILQHSTDHWRRIWYAYLTSGARKTELANCVFSDVDWPKRELVIRPSYSKNGLERRIPLDDRLYEIIVQQEERAKNRQPGKWADKKTTALIKERFSQRHIFVTTANTPLGANVYREFMATCKRAGICTATTDGKGRVVESVCLHSTRHTFASNLIVNGADPRSVQYLLGHRTLDMTMKVYAKLIPGQTRDAISKLSIGTGISFKND